MEKRTLRDYEHDPQFRSLVDMLASMIINLETTPAELRQAVIAASILVERQRGPAPVFRGEDGRLHFKENASAPNYPDPVLGHMLDDQQQ